MFRKVGRKRSEAVVIFSKGTCPWTFYTLKIIMIIINDNNDNFKILQLSERSRHLCDIKVILEIDNLHFYYEPL